MPTFAFLVLPAVNRVYARATVDLAQAELEVVAATMLTTTVNAVGSRMIGNVPYITFEADELSDRDAAHLANLSSIYALYEMRGDALHPRGLQPLDRFDDDLLTIQRYTGKTNEQFTKLLLNVILAHSRRAVDLLEHPARVLDPLCGRGTTLNQALMYGFDAAGIERDARVVDAYEAFVKGWLREKRIKHRSERARVRRSGKVVGRRFDITIGSDQRLSVVHDDTTTAPDHFAKSGFDVIVADLPYGVQHASRTESHAHSRDPAALVGAAAPAWISVLAVGGAIGLSWNTRVLARHDLARLLTGAGLDVVDTPAMHRFGHRVDQSIRRDLIVATRCR
jgi:hypothetical protein